MVSLYPIVLFLELPQAELNLFANESDEKVETWNDVVPSVLAKHKHRDTWQPERNQVRQGKALPSNLGKRP